jgi:cell division protein FtsZ
MAVSSPLLEASMEGAQGVLISIAGGSDLGLFEINAAAELITEAAHEEANVIFGTVIDDALGDEVRVTVIAAGFEGGAPLPRVDRPRPTYRTEPVAAPVPPVVAPPVTHVFEDDGVYDLQADDESIAPDPRPAPRVAPRPAPRPERRTVVFDDDELDVPDFLK